MRLFIAVEIDKNLKRKILEIQDKFRESGVIIKHVEPENLHFNLKFIGEADDSRVSAIGKALENIFKSTKSFKIHVFGAGAFPNEDYIRILWLGVKKVRKSLLKLLERSKKN